MAVKLYLTSLGWDMDKIDWIIARDKQQALDIIMQLYNDMDYTMQEFIDEWGIMEIPWEILTVFLVQAEKDKVPSLEYQAEMNGRRL